MEKNTIDKLNKKVEISATIVTYNNDEVVLKATINSFLEASLNLKLYIVDNSESKKIQDYCDDERIEYIHSGCNKGFGFGHNIVLKNQSLLGKYHIILNPDIVIPKGVLEELYNYYETNSSIGMLCPRILYPDKTIQYLPKLLPLPLNLIIRFVPFLHLLFKRQSDNYVLKNGDYSKPLKVAIVSGCFMMLRKSNLSPDHIFDERFFMYFEDFDLSRRIGLKNELVMYPQAEIIHNYGRGAHRSFRLFKVFIASMIKYFNKWGWLFDSGRAKTNREILKQF